MNLKHAWQTFSPTHVARRPWKRSWVNSKTQLCTHPHTHTHTHTCAHKCAQTDTEAEVDEDGNPVDIVYEATAEELEEERMDAAVRLIQGRSLTIPSLILV